MHSAISDLSCYVSLFTKCGAKARGRGAREPDQAIFANLLFPYNTSLKPASKRWTPNTALESTEADSNLQNPKASIVWERTQMACKISRHALGHRLETIDGEAYLLILKH